MELLLEEKMNNGSKAAESIREEAIIIEKKPVLEYYMGLGYFLDVTKIDENSVLANIYFVDDDDKRVETKMVVDKNGFSFTPKGQYDAESTFYLRVKS